MLRIRTPGAARGPGNAAGKHWAALVAASVFTILVLTYRPALAADSLSPGAGKVVLVDFWASWCEPCRHSFPWMNDMQKKYAHDGLVIVAVNVDNDRAAARRFLDENPTELEIRYDDDRSLARRFEVVAMPSSFLLDEHGEVVERHLGFKVLKQDEYEAAIKAALGKE